MGGDVALLDPRVIARKEISDKELQVVDPEAFRAFQVRTLVVLTGCGVVSCGVVSGVSFVE